MTSAEILKYLQEEIHTTVAASADREGLPVILCDRYYGCR